MANAVSFVLLVSLTIGTYWTNAADDAIDADALSKEMGYFSKCKGKDVHFPETEVQKGLVHAGVCTGESYFKGFSVSKPCIALCVAEKLGYMFPNMTYNLDAATKPMMDTLTEKDPTKKNEQIVVDTQVAALRRCGGTAVYELKGECEEAKKFDACIKEASVKDCAP